MTDFIKEIILTNLYWFSLPLIGYVFLRMAKDIRLLPVSLRNVANIVLKQHAFCVFVASYAVTATIFALISVFFYLFRLPVLPFVLIYLLLLTISAVYLLNNIAKNGFTCNFVDLVGRSYITRTLFIIVVIFLSVIFVIDVYNGSLWARDALYHMSRMVDILANGFNVQNGFHYNLPESAYHYNVVYSMFVIPAKLFGVELIAVWKYSLGFFVLTSLLTSFTFALFIFSSWIKTRKYALPLALLSIFPVVAFHFSLAFIYNYPNKIVITWITLLIICLSIKINKSNFKTVLSAVACLALLITMTHPLYSVIFVCFLSLFIFIRLIIEQKGFIRDKLSMILYSITILILMIGPLVTVLTPNRLSRDFIDTEEHSRMTVLGIKIINPDLIPESAAGGVLLLLGIVSSVYLLMILRKNKQDLSLALSLMLFYAFFAFTPMYMLLEKIVPVWIVARFEDVSEILFQHYLIIGIFCLFGLLYALIKRSGPRPVEKRIVANAMQVSFVIVVIAFCIVNIQISLSNTGGAINRAHDYGIGEALVENNKDIFKENRLVLSRYDITFSSLFPIDIIFVSRGHQPLASDGYNRELCKSHILNTFGYADLKAVGVRYVLDNKFYAEKYIAGKPYLKLIRSNDNFDLFGSRGLYIYELIDIPGYDDNDVYGPCLEYQRNEEK